MSEAKTKISVLVTGAGGFVGRHICRYLVRRGFTVRAAVRRPPVLAEAGLDYAVVGEIDDHTDWRAALRGIHLVVHAAGTTEDFAAPVGGNLVAHNQVNFAGTAALAQAAGLAGVRRLIFLSSVGVRSAELAEEETTAFQQSKRDAEQVLLRTLGNAATELVILRLPPLYGPEKHGALRMLAEALRRGRPLPLASIQNQISPLFVGNLVSAVDACLRNGGSAGRVFELSDGEVVSTPELVTRLAEAMDLEAELWPCPPALLSLAARATGYDPVLKTLTDEVVFDDQEIVRALSWTPPIEIDRALQATVRSWQLEQAPETVAEARGGPVGKFTDFVFDLSERIVRFKRGPVVEKIAKTVSS